MSWYKKAQGLYTYSPNYNTKSWYNKARGLYTDSKGPAAGTIRHAGHILIAPIINTKSWYWYDTARGL